MARAAGARVVALDTTVVRHFHDGGFVLDLARYLKKSAFVVDDVHRELTYQARSRPVLEGLLAKTRWPQLFDPLPKKVIERGLQIQALWLVEGDPEDAHLGEIFTVLAAVHFKADLLITDDRNGSALAGAELVPSMRAGELISEMVQASVLALEDGWTIYQLTRKAPKRERYDSLISAARAESLALARAGDGRSRGNDCASR